MISVAIELVFNIAILVALSLISGFIRQREETPTREAVLQGLLFGVAAVIGMYRPMVLGPGLIFDGRSVMISLGALYFGPVAALVSAAVSLPYRVQMGGAGVYMGSLTIVVSALWGLYFRQRWQNRSQPITTRGLLTLGVWVHISVLSLVITLPAQQALDTLKNVALPMLLAYPLITLLIGKLLSGQEAALQTVKALRESELRHRMLADNVTDVIWTMTPDGRFTYVSPSVLKLRGFTAPEVMQQSMMEALCPGSQGLAMQHLQVAMNAPPGPKPPDLCIELEQPHKNGGSVWTEATITGLRDASGKLTGALGVSRDITERKQAEQRLRLTASVFTHAREGITITDPKGVIVDVNASFSRITGYSRDEVLGQTPRMISSGHHYPSFYQEMWHQLLSTGQWYGEIWNRRKNGEVFAEMLNISAVRDAHGQTQNYVALFSDITAIKHHEQELEHIAHYDVLTGLPNRVLLADRLRQAMTQASRREQQVAVVYLDLDGFKTVNDRYGHEVGDQLLMTVANRMKAALRDCDTLGRIGGDEFVAVLIDLEDSQACVPLLARLLTAAAEAVTQGELALQISASLGVTLYPQADELEADQLLRQADQAMYQAKLAGKNRYHFFDDAQDRQARGQHEILTRIRQALARHEFVLFYQPKVNMRSGELIGAEALIRWQHPQQGLLAPARFLPAIEEHPLAVEVGEWVLAQALVQMAQWQAAGLTLPVSVNVGARQLQQPNFVARLRALLVAQPTVRPEQLEIEVLETSALEDIQGVSQVIQDCASLGVRFALDDFGTGYSSLTYLKRLPVAVLKIDQSFVRDMLVDADDLAILQGIIGLASAFRREVIAEGVETAAHGQRLLQLGCELGQGYGIARPMPAGEVMGWAERWRVDPVWAAPVDPVL